MHHLANRLLESEAELLRRNCVATKMLSVYAKWKGAAYLKSTLQKVLERLVHTSKDLDLELDPARTASVEELQKNALQLRVVTKVFIDDICNSAVHIPVSFRRIGSIVSYEWAAMARNVLTHIPDIKCGHEEVSRSKVHRSGSLHLPTILLSSHRCSRCRGLNKLATFKRDAAWALAHSQSCTEFGQQRLVRSEGAVYVPSK